MLKTKILILDTNNTKQISQMLLREGSEVVVANSISEVTGYITHRTFDLFIVRPEQPEQINVLLAQFPPETSILVVCPENTVGSMIEHINGTGVCNFISQPFTVKRYKEAINKILNKTHIIEDRIRSKVLASLERVNHVLADGTESDSFFKLVVEMSKVGTKSDYVSLIIKNGVNGDYEIKASLGENYKQFENLCRLVMLKNEPVIIDTAVKNEQRLCKQMHAEGISSLLSLPIMIKGENSGALNLLKQTGNGTFSSNDLNFVSILGSWIGINLENMRLFKKVETQAVHVESLLHEILYAQQNERKRVAIEIHDGVAQWMVGASFGIKACSTLISESRLTELATELDKIRETMQKSVRELRRAISDLRPIPLEEIGLIPALCKTSESLSQEGIKCRLEVDEELPVLSLAEETAIYWIAQESFSNIRKHSGATDVEVKLYANNGEFTIEVGDNGNGFDPEATLSNSLMLEHMGLVGMQERARLIGGAIRVKSAPGLGSSIILSIPVSSRQVIKTLHEERTEHEQIT